MFFPRQVRLGRIAPLPAALGARRRPRAAAGSSRGTATRSRPRRDRLRARPRPLLLLLWHRIALDDPRLTVSGSRAAADAVLAAALTP